MPRPLLPLLLLLGACASAADDGGKDGKPQPLPCGTAGLRPGLRSDHDAVYLKSLDTIVVFGGDRAAFDTSQFPPSVYTAEVWHYGPSCGTWDRVDAGTGPDRRGAYAAVADEKRERVIVIGGRSGTDPSYRVNNDVWAYAPRTRSWTQLHPHGHGPGPRDGHRAVYDAARDRVLLYGGNESTMFGEKVMGDTWELSFHDDANGSWRSVFTSPPGDPRQDAALAIDEQRGVMLLFGGAYDFISYSNDVWAFDLVDESWHLVEAREDARAQVRGDRVPTQRFWPEMVASGDGVFFVFGGHDAFEQGNRNDLWKFTLDDGTLESGQWQVVLEGDVSLDEPDLTSPERRDEHSLVWIPEGLWLFGGTTDCGPIDDMWTFGTSGWQPTLPATVSETCVRRATPGQVCEHLSCAAPL